MRQKIAASTREGLHGSADARNREGWTRLSCDGSQRRLRDLGLPMDAQACKTGGSACTYIHIVRAHEMEPREGRCLNGNDSQRPH